MDRRPVLLVLGGLLIVGGLAIWLTGDFALATRRPGGAIRFAGAARALAGLAPVLVGAGLCALAGGPARERLAQLAVGGGIAAGLTALMLAGRG